jgi:hypothetical protein
MPTVETAAVTACAFIALYAGHQLGDHVVQPAAAVAGKGCPGDDRLAAGVPPWTGWASCARHVLSYVAVQTVAVLLMAVVAPFTAAGAVAALTISGATHAVVDRRWIVRAIVRAKRCADWADGPYLIDQSLHVAALLVAAVVAGVVTTGLGLSVVVAAAAALVVAVLLRERARASALARAAVTDERRSA